MFDKINKVRHAKLPFKTQRSEFGAIASDLCPMPRTEVPAMANDEPAGRQAGDEIRTR
jgi:hypothetical protein